MNVNTATATIHNIYVQAISGGSTKKDTIRQMQGALYSMASNPRLHANRINHLTTALEAYQGLNANHGTALNALQRARNNTL
jgi:uncharacterized protein YpuA (DUF1002 family)